MATELEGLTQRLHRFDAERGWQWLHAPNNLSVALAGAAGELLAEFQ